MRKEQKQSIENFQLRCDLTIKQIDDISQHLASTFGPIIISSLIEHGMLVFKNRDRNKDKLKKKFLKDKK